MNILAVLSSAMNAAVKASGAATRAVIHPFMRLLHFILTYFPDVFRRDWQTFKLVAALLAAGAVIGVASVTIFLQEDDAGPPAVSTSVAISGSATATLAPSVLLTATARAATPVATSTPAPRIITLRGEIDVSPATASGLIISKHDIEILVFEDNGTVTGSYTLVIEEFAIGQLLAAVFASPGDPEWGQFRTCTVSLILPATLSGTYDRGAGVLAGEAVITPVTQDSTGCLATRPANVSLDSVTTVSTVAWRASFDGGTATGALGLDPALRFSAAAID